MNKKLEWDVKSRDGKMRTFRLEDPELPKWISDHVIDNGIYPYSKKYKREAYEKELLALQIELAKLQAHVIASGERVMMIFEGRDTAGKGGTIKRFMEYLNPRQARTIALGKPTETERKQLYFQRYFAHLPAEGDIVLFDRSWYNRAGVERVMGFCTPDQLAAFLREVPEVESMLVRDGIKFFKFFLTIGREAQLERFHGRWHSPLRRWKLSEKDLEAISRWDDYTAAQREMFPFSHTPTAPWTLIRANDKRRARLNAMRVVLSAIDYPNKDVKAIGKIDPKIVSQDGEFHETS